LGGISEQHRQTFEARLARIQNGGPNTMGTLHVGPRDEVRASEAKVVEKAHAKARKTRSRRGSPLATVLLLPVALALGALSVFVGRVAAYRLFTDDGIYPMTVAGVPAEMFGDIAIAAVLAMVLAWTFHLTWGMRRVALVAGFIAMMVGEVNLMQSFPDLFATFFSDTYVAGMLADPPATL
jgi:hypothetical protein